MQRHGRICKQCDDSPGTRDCYELYTPYGIGSLEIANRFVRSATADLGPWKLGQFTDEDIALYSELARGQVGLLIANGPGIFTEEALAGGSLDEEDYSYRKVRVQGTERLLAAVHDAAPKCKIFAQIGCNEIVSCDLPKGPSAIDSPYYEGTFRQLSAREIEWMIDALVQTIVRMRDEGFDGAQLHAAHGGGLWSFLSPYSNRRKDRFGGSVAKRVCIVREIVGRARAKVGAFPILIKVNCDDFLDGGIDSSNFPELASQIQQAGIDAIEVSGGTWDALVRTEEELGFRPVPAAESRTDILTPEKQSYFLPAVIGLALDIPIILVGGNRNVERMEKIISEGHAQFVAMCRPLIREPELVERWRKGRGGEEALCIACNSCIYSMHVPFEKLGRRVVSCLPEMNPSLHDEAQEWLGSFIDSIRVD